MQASKLACQTLLHYTSSHYLASLVSGYQNLGLVDDLSTAGIAALLLKQRAFISSLQGYIS